MKTLQKITFILLSAVVLSSCVAKKKYAELQSQLDAVNSDLNKRGEMVNDYKNQVRDLEQKLAEDKKLANSKMESREQQISSLNSQIEDLKKQRDSQMKTVGDLTVLTQQASNNVDKTLQQIAQKDQYISALRNAKNKSDSLNLALAVNLTGMLSDGINDEDIDVKIDKTVVMINISDKMLFKSGSAQISSRAGGVLAKIAKIIESRPDLEVMVEGYTDNNPIRTASLKDNWDLSVIRSTSVVRTLQEDYGVNPNRLIAAGRGEYNTLASNATPEGKAINRRTRIILMPKLDQFYNLLDPDKAPK
ncbi:chemotaxis protein MotB [Spirosomataceae bacterium TFI 002]|nr:chemotaxis protein MotB [Spirosomataceae bacterium TFI 002]